MNDENFGEKKTDPTVASACSRATVEEPLRVMINNLTLLSVCEELEDAMQPCVVFDADDSDGDICRKAIKEMQRSLKEAHDLLHPYCVRVP